MMPPTAADVARTPYPPEIDGFRLSDLRHSCALRSDRGEGDRRWTLSAFLPGRGLALAEGHTHYGLVLDGRVGLLSSSGVFYLGAGMYFCAPGGGEVGSGSGRGVVVSVPDYAGVFGVGGPVEAAGRLRYIDGCTDSLLLPPPRRGDPCLNHLHFPPGVDQTMHTHPTVRIGIVTGGRGICRTPSGPVNLTPGLAWVLAPGGVHGFRTSLTESMDVVVFHPDTTSGPTDEAHPMLDRTIIGGVSASELRADGVIA